MERVPVPVRSGLYSPEARIVRMRLRYWCSSWLGLCARLGVLPLLVPVDGVSAEGDILLVSFDVNRRKAFGIRDSRV